MTATEIDPGSSTGFGATSEFGGQTPLMTDVSVEMSILNPETVAAGGDITYQVTYKNNGPDDLDLTQYSTVGGGPYLFVDYAPPELTAVNIVSAGPIPGSSIVDVGNSDLTCVWAPQGSAGAFFGLTTYGDHSILACWFTGANTNLTSGQSVSATLGYNLASDSDLSFGNYVQATFPEGDPDIARFLSIDHGDYNNDVVELYLAYRARGEGFNNFDVAEYPVPVEPEQPSGGGQSGGIETIGQDGSSPVTGAEGGNDLASTGDNAIKLITGAISLIGLSFLLKFFKKEAQA